MSEFRVEKSRTEAELTLSNGESLRGCFYVSPSSATHAGPERVTDLLNLEPGFFPFGREGGGTVLVNSAHMVTARLLGTTSEAQRDAGYDVAQSRRVVMKLSNRVVLRGLVRVYCPAGRDRLSDYARAPHVFRYVENEDGTFVVNSHHIVELAEIA
jgi:hypothetical protein